MKRYVLLLLVLTSPFLSAQSKAYIDKKYYEDQFYVGVQYNSLLRFNNPVSNKGVPYSFEAGFIKDMPLNSQRNVGMGLGIGYSYDVLRPNITAAPNGNGFDFEISNRYNSYQYASHNLEIPLEFRWRTSTPVNTSFWRIYTGISFIYNLSNQTSFGIGNTSVNYRNLEALQKTNYTAYTSIGFGTWNFHIKYYLLSPFKNTVRSVNAKKFSFRQLKIGVMFYML